MFWQTFMAVVNLMHMSISPFRLFFVLEPVNDLHIHFLDQLMLALYAICVVDIIMKFNTGYIDTNNSIFVMGRKAIIW